MKTYHKNPRQITERQFKDLEKWLEELGDLGGIVHDLNSDEVIGGNQRARVFDILRQENAPIVLTDEFSPPTRQGTVALGYIQWRGEQYGYRQVRWTARQCEQANVVANRAGGAWDWDVLANEFEMGDLLEWGFKDFELGLGNELELDYKPSESNNKGYRDMTFILLPEQLERVELVLNDIISQGVEYPDNEHLLSNALYFLCCSYAET
jgi:hypothetical protein